MAAVLTPYDEDSIVTSAAKRAGLSVYRSMAIEITDPKAIKAAGLMRETPDYTRIRKLLEDGAEVAGARLAGTEYILKPRKGGIEQ